MVTDSTETNVERERGDAPPGPYLFVVLEGGRPMAGGARLLIGGGLQGSSQVAITITVLAATSTSQRTLAVRKVVNEDSGRAILTWAGVSGTSVDIYRNGTKLTATSNDGYFKNYLTLKSATYSYKVCASGTQTCTNTASITF